MADDLDKRCPAETFARYFDADGYCSVMITFNV
jgi:hypothetical protein